MYETRTDILYFTYETQILKHNRNLFRERNRPFFRSQRGTTVHVRTILDSLAVTL